MFSTGQEVTLPQVLDAREQRVVLQKQLLTQYPETTLVNYKCNIPGPIKNNNAIKALFQKGLDEILTAFIEEEFRIITQKILNGPTGIEAFILVKNEVTQVKEVMVSIELASPLGRLYDIDVLCLPKNEEDTAQPLAVSSISRTELGYPERSCILCDQSAKACGRNRTHSVTEMQDYIASLVVAHL